MKNKNFKNRIFLIDEVRGFAILCMVVYHAFYDLTSIFGLSIPFFYSNTMNFLRDCFVFIFVFISGASSRFSKNNIKRGFIILGFGFIMTIFTYFFFPSQLIVFGILHMLGVCIILFGLFHNFLDKIPNKIFIPSVIFLFLITIGLQYGFVGIPYLFQINLPLYIYNTNFLFPLGITSHNFFSADYFPLFPWFFCFLLGSSFGKFLQLNKAPQFFYKNHIKFLSFLGRHTLIIYIFHQPVLFSLFYLISIILIV